MFLTGAIDTFLAIVAYVTAMGHLYSASKQVIRTVKRRVMPKMLMASQKKWVGRCVNSFRPLRPILAMLIMLIK